MASHVESINLLDNVDTDLYADCVEWCPLDGHENILLCGTYQLEANPSSDPNNSKRKGCIHVYCLNQDKLLLHSRVDGSGILDLKWSPCEIHNGTGLIGSVTSDGHLDLYHFENKQGIKFLKQSSIILEDDGLALSLDWFWTDKRSSDLSAIISTSKGNLFNVTICEDDTKIASQWKAHDFEAWICAFDRWNDSIIYSGADDCKLKGWDLRNGDQKPIFVSNKHSMGVTSIQCSFRNEHHLASGSYDENVLLWDSRNMSNPMSSLHLGGGVWKLKWEPEKSNYLAAACMHNGVQIVNFHSGTDPKIEASFTAHESLAYGIDWKRDSHVKHMEKIQHEQNKFTLASCSFYDHRTCLWSWKPNII